MHNFFIVYIIIAAKREIGSFSLTNSMAKNTHIHFFSCSLRHLDRYYRFHCSCIPQAICIVFHDEFNSILHYRLYNSLVVRLKRKYYLRPKQCEAQVFALTLFCNKIKELNYNDQTIMAPNRINLSTNHRKLLQFCCRKLCSELRIIFV